MKILLSDLTRKAASKPKARRAKLPGEPRLFKPRKESSFPAQHTVSMAGPDDFEQARKEKELHTLLSKQGIPKNANLFQALLHWERS